MSLFGDITRGLGDVATFGSNELLGNPLGKFADQIVNPQDPNASAYARQDAINRQNIDLQREFAQHGIQWRVADAAAAGLSPLAALGAQEPSFQPVSNTVFPGDTAVRDTGLRMFSGMGQDLFKHLLSASSDSARKLEVVNLRKATAEADLADLAVAHSKLELARDMHPPNPAVPFRGVYSDTQTYVDSQGNKYEMPSEDYARAAHGTLFGPSEWYFRNKLINPLTDLVHNVGFGNVGGSYVNNFGGN